jgi:surfactin synthase thioesterase subunit
MAGIAASNPWVVPLPGAERPRVRLFCLPYAGGGTIIYRRWPALVSADIRVYAVALPGREQRITEPPMSDAAHIAEALASAIAPYAGESFAVFGHSMGAAIAYETALAIIRTGGQAPLCLMVSARRAPHRPQRKRLVHRLPDEEFVAELQRLNGSPPGVFDDPELMALMLPILRNDFQLTEAYFSPAPARLRCPIIAFGGASDAEVELLDLAAWQELTSGEFRLHVLSGDHFFINTNQCELGGLVTSELVRLLR